MADSITNHWEYEEALVRERAGLRAEIERLRAALKPFAEMADAWKDEPDSLEVELKAYDEPGPGLSVADFRAAKFAHEQSAPK